MLLVVIRSVDDVIACFDLLKELAGVVRGGLAVVIKADKDMTAKVSSGEESFTRMISYS